jgi:hypothetical protein
MELHTCPVRLVTPDVEGLFGLFAATHELRVGLAGARWERTALPTHGGIDAQPARDLQALGLIATVRNAWLASRAQWDAARKRAR